MGPSTAVFVPKALQSVPGERWCAGCGQSFTATRRNQLHCRPSCRKLALERRRAAAHDDGDRLADLFE